MKLVSLKLSKKEAKEDYGVPAQSATKADLPRYPYGMELRLDTETLKKLGIDVSSYPVGTECVIEATGKVTRTSESEDQAGGERCSMEIQITEAAIEPDKKAKKAKADNQHLNEISSSTSAPAYDEDE